MAEAQHEIVLLLMKKQEYDKAMVEASKIFDMRWPGDQEPLLLKELLNLADQFLSQGQAPLGLKLIERNFKYFKKTSSQAAILKEMGYLYKSLKQDDKAIESSGKPGTLKAAIRTAEDCGLEPSPGSLDRTKSISPAGITRGSAVINWGILESVSEIPSHGGGAKSGFTATTASACRRQALALSLKSIVSNLRTIINRSGRIRRNIRLLSTITNGQDCRIGK